MPYSARSEARPFSAKISSRDHPDFRPLKSVAGDLSEPCRLPVAWMDARLAPAGWTPLGCIRGRRLAACAPIWLRPPRMDNPARLETFALCVVDRAVPNPARGTCACARTRQLSNARRVHRPRHPGPSAQLLVARRLPVGAARIEVASRSAFEPQRSRAHVQPVAQNAPFRLSSARTGISTHNTPARSTRSFIRMPQTSPDRRPVRSTSSSASPTVRL